MDKIKKRFPSYLPRLSAAAAANLMRRFPSSEEMEGRGRKEGVSEVSYFIWNFVGLKWKSLHGCLFPSIVKSDYFTGFCNQVSSKHLENTVSYGKIKTSSHTSFLPDNQALTWKAKEASYSHACQVATAGMESGLWGLCLLWSLGRCKSLGETWETRRELAREWGQETGKRW